MIIKKFKEINSNSNSNQKQQEKNQIMEELIMQSKMLEFNRNCSSKFLAISTLSYMYGLKSYSFLRRWLPLPH